MSLTHLDLFTGGGGGVLAAKALRHDIVGMCEIGDARHILEARQRDRLLPNVTIHLDVTKLDGRAYRGVDIVAGGFPCQDLSTMNVTGKGLEGARSGLGWHMLRVGIEADARYIFAENVVALRNRGLDKIISMATRYGYRKAIYGVMGARHMGSEHWRNRLWLMLAKGATNDVSEVSFPMVRSAPAFHVPTPLRHDAQEALAYCEGRRASLPQILGITRRGYDSDIPLSHLRPSQYVAGARLNPRTYEALMGWPDLWTNTAARCPSDKIVMPRYRHFPLLTVADKRAIRALGNGQVPIVAAYVAKHFLARLAL